MSFLLEEIRHNRVLWLLVFIPAVFAVKGIEPEAHTLLFVLALLAIVPLATLLSHATSPSLPRQAIQLEAFLTPRWAT